MGNTVIIKNISFGFSEKQIVFGKGINEQR